MRRHPAPDPLFERGTTKTNRKVKRKKYAFVLFLPSLALPLYIHSSSLQLPFPFPPVLLGQPVQKLQRHAPRGVRVRQGHPFPQPLHLKPEGLAGCLLEKGEVLALAAGDVVGEGDERLLFGGGVLLVESMLCVFVFVFVVWCKGDRVAESESKERKEKTHGGLRIHPGISRYTHTHILPSRTCPPGRRQPWMDASRFACWWCSHRHSPTSATSNPPPPARASPSSGKAASRGVGSAPHK